MYVYVCVCVCTHIYIYIYTCITILQYIILSIIISILSPQVGRHWLSVTVVSVYPGAAAPVILIITLIYV